MLHRESHHIASHLSIHFGCVYVCRGRLDSCNQIRVQRARRAGITRPPLIDCGSHSTRSTSIIIKFTLVRHIIVFDTFNFCIYVSYQFLFVCHFFSLNASTFYFVLLYTFSSTYIKIVYKYYLSRFLLLLI